jgi:hypothetical protein
MITLGGCNSACGDAFERVWGSTVLRALRALGDKLALEDASNVALAVGVTRIPQMPGNREYSMLPYPSI